MHSSSQKSSIRDDQEDKNSGGNEEDHSNYDCSIIESDNKSIFL